LPLPLPLSLVVVLSREELFGSDMVWKVVTYYFC
jgi:hypothetical protein